MEANDEIERDFQVRLAELGSRIGMAASRLGTRTDAYKMLQISSATLQRYINGETMPALDVASKLCHSAGVRLDWLATGEGPMLAAYQVGAEQLLDSASGVAESEPQQRSHNERLDGGKLMEALALIDQALALTRRTASVEARIRLAGMAYDVLRSETDAATALRSIMAAVDTETGDAS